MKVNRNFLSPADRAALVEIARDGLWENRISRRANAILLVRDAAQISCHDVPHRQSVQAACLGGGGSPFQPGPRRMAASVFDCGNRSGEGRDSELVEHAPQRHCRIDAGQRAIFFGRLRLPLPSSRNASNPSQVSSKLETSARISSRINCYRTVQYRRVSRLRAIRHRVRDRESASPRRKQNPGNRSHDGATAPLRRFSRMDIEPIIYGKSHARTSRPSKVVRKTFMLVLSIQ